MPSVAHQRYRLNTGLRHSCRLFAAHERGNVVDGREISEIEVALLNLYAESLFDKGQQLRRQQRIDETRLEDIAVIAQLSCRVCLMMKVRTDCRSSGSVSVCMISTD